MQKHLNIAARLAVGVCYFVLAGSAHAQQWYNTTQQATPVAPPTQEAKETKDWNYTIGGGVGYAPTYEGSDEYDVLPVPVVNIDYKDGLFFANVRHGIGSYPLRGENYKVGVSLGYASGRDDSDDRKNLTGMGDVDASATANLLGEYDCGPAKLSGRVTSAVSGDYGTTAEVNLGSRCHLTQKIIMSSSIGNM